MAAQSLRNCRLFGFICFACPFSKKQHFHAAAHRFERRLNSLGSTYGFSESFRRTLF